MSGLDIAVVIAAVLVVLLLLAIAGRFQRITIFEYQRGLKFRGGRGPDLLEPGQYWIFRPSTFVHVIDTREQFMSVAGQELVTFDSVSLKLSVLARYRVTDPRVAFLQVSDYLGALYSLVQIGLREVISIRSVDDVLEKRDEIGPEVVQRVTDKVRTLGVELVSIDVRDLMFPGPLKKTFGQVLEAKQQGLAALEKARGETAALRSLANAARMVEANPALLQLRLVQQLESTRGHTVVLGLPSTSTPLPVKSTEQEPAGELPPPTRESGQ